MEKRYLKVEELATYLGLSPETIRAWVKKRQIPFYKLGRAVRFDKHEIDKWLESKKRLCLA
jgi:excisionase family DNA binding protein